LAENGILGLTLIFLAATISKIKIEIVFFLQLNRNAVNDSSNQAIDFRRRDEGWLTHNKE